MPPARLPTSSETMRASPVPLPPQIALTLSLVFSDGVFVQLFVADDARQSSVGHVGARQLDAVESPLLHRGESFRQVLAGNNPNLGGEFQDGLRLRLGPRLPFFRRDRAREDGRACGGDGPGGQKSTS